MAEIIHLRRTPHEEVQMLLPWYLNGTLEAGEREQVEAHLDDCSECRADLDAERGLASSIAELASPDEWGAPHRAGAPVKPVVAPVAFLRRRVPLGWALAGPLATAAALVLAFHSPSVSGPADAPYQALGAESGQAAGNVVVVFDPARSEGDIRALLLEVGGTIVDGPNASGAYVLLVPSEHRGRAIDRLRGSSQVVLAEPIERG